MRVARNEGLRGGLVGRKTYLVEVGGLALTASTLLEGSGNDGGGGSEGRDDESGELHLVERECGSDKTREECVESVWNACRERIG